MYQVRSGLLLVDAAALAEMADELWHEREGILAEAGGRHPESGSEVWAQWVAARVSSLDSAVQRVGWVTMNSVVMDSGYIQGCISPAAG